MHKRATLYFAYGSNLNKRQMLERCPDATAVRGYELLGWKLLFRRTADIVPAFGSTVLGGLYRITSADGLALDRYEGVRRGRYRREYFQVGGQPVLTYVMNNSNPEEAPSAQYFELIEQGYRDWQWPVHGLITAYLHTKRFTAADELRQKTVDF